ncbi:hypothetical protein [Enterococcus faecalis]|uniref:hypothetical protein n=1 Tax=Enterococcus faecalis TaxID=1351 RepID=UPI0004A78739|nr:hypothetical protein [Enterococcus faecalis]EGO2601800.1 hypothetical protein [Enterococcus faecalis]EGO7961117.1 hypothetical protein [Enterococcus faecalis]EGO8967010.1 hypothetical protein [Enterococcus faecalis]EGO9504138.1 hypothetical protein [Enterococcus faecalis]EIM5394303.1 hypothetical protein [Enterococcus faecalis]
MVRRTKKEFKPYNDYVDRPFELKWQTAFPLGELTEAIKSTDEYHARNIERLPQQSQAQIEYLLDRSMKQNKVLEIQLNSLDEYERVKPHLFGVFRGMAEFDVVLLGDTEIDFYDIRHIKIHDFRKWSQVYTAEDSFEEQNVDSEIEDFVQEYWDNQWLD